MMYVRLLALPAKTRRRYRLSSLRFVASTGAPCAPDLKPAMIDWLGPIMHETYASAECRLITAIGAAGARPASASAVGDVRLAILGELGRRSGRANRD